MSGVARRRLSLRSFVGIALSIATMALTVSCSTAREVVDPAAATPGYKSFVRSRIVFEYPASWRRYKHGDTSHLLSPSSYTIIYSFLKKGETRHYASATDFVQHEIDSRLGSQGFGIESRRETSLSGLQGEELIYHSRSSQSYGEAIVSPIESGAMMVTRMVVLDDRNLLTIVQMMAATDK
jgi:hypothetical protein